MRLSPAWIVSVFLVGGAVAGELDRGRGRDRPDRVVDNRDARGLASRIDAKLVACWVNAKVRPVAKADDGEFLRRVSLDLVGRIPTAAEARDFLDDPNPAKRAALVDRLLDSPAYAARTTMLWRQLLLPESGQGVGGPGGFEAWLAKKVGEEAGYDRIVREILSVKIGDRNPNAMTNAQFEATPAAFYAAKGGKPEALAADSARAFLGIRLECAECHNHPFAKWKREEFWGFAAFFAGVPEVPDANAVAVAVTQRVKDDPARRELTIPGTSTVVKATHLDRSPPSWRPRAETREVLAEWVTSPDNPYFARAAVNRAWARFFGVGLIDPVDDLDAAADPALVAVLDDVAIQFRDHGYDLKYLIRALMATEAYNLSSAVDPAEPTPPPLFARMPVRGLSPGQFIDSLAQATGSDVGGIRGGFLELFSDRDATPTEAQTSILQALTLMNGAFVAAATDPATGDVLGAIADAPYLDTAGRVEFLYLATLTRRPTPEERDKVVAYVDRKAGGPEKARALADAFWALLNGPEFRINH